MPHLLRLLCWHCCPFERPHARTAALQHPHGKDSVRQQQYGLRPVLIDLVTIPYAIKALFRFIFYWVDLRDQERLLQRLANVHASPMARPALQVVR